MNSRSDSIHVNFDHDPSLVSGVFGPQIQSCLCNKLAGCSCGLWLLQFVNSVFHNSYIWDKIVLKMENSMKNQVTLAQAVFDRMLYFLITVKKLR